jgi:glutathione peroxidase
MNLFKNFALLAGFALLACNQNTPENKVVYAMSEVNASTTFYDFKATGIMGDDFDFATLKGKRVLIVNTASKCGFTPQYKELQELYDQYGGENFEIIGFPANNFGFQEPGSNDKIAEFCEKNFGVTFRMMEKVSVKGKDIHPLYSWLTSKELNGISDASVKWNFHKFLVDENGVWVASLASSVSPLDMQIVNFAARKN